MHTNRTDHYSHATCVIKYTTVTTSVCNNWVVLSVMTVLAVHRSWQRLCVDKGRENMTCVNWRRNLFDIVNDSLIAHRDYCVY